MDFGAFPIGFAEPIMGSVEWSDFDNDGDPDLLLCGLDHKRPSANLRLTIYENTGSSFVPSEMSGVAPGVARWADFNQDNLPDFVASGLSDAGPVTIAYKQLPGGSFVDNQSATPIYGLHNPVLAWADWNKDTYPDFVISGLDPAWKPFTIIYTYDTLTGRFEP